MGKKFIMINGVKTYIEEEGKPEEAAPAEAPNLEEQAKMFGQAVAKEVAAVLNLGAKKEAPEVSSKIAKILKGKDLNDKNALTAEEKIVAFYHGLVTKDVAVCKALSEGTAASR